MNEEELQVLVSAKLISSPTGRDPAGRPRVPEHVSQTQERVMS